MIIKLNLKATFYKQIYLLMCWTWLMMILLWLKWRQQDTDGAFIIRKCQKTKDVKVVFSTKNCHFHVHVKKSLIAVKIAKIKITNTILIDVLTQLTLIKIESGNLRKILKKAALDWETLVIHALWTQVFNVYLIQKAWHNLWYKENTNNS